MFEGGTDTIIRRVTRQIRLGKLLIGGDAAVSVQSMCNTKTHDVAATVAQIKRMEACGCDIVRVAVPDMPAAEAISAIRKEIDIPLVADIHFDYRLALRAAENGVDGLRINPGNIGGMDNVQQVVASAKAHGIPIRIGVNAGSLEKELLEKHGRPTAAALCESAMGHVKLLERCNFFNIKISLKAHDVPLTIAAYREMAQLCDYPLHVGITEAGTLKSGVIKSAVGIGTLLAEGIGDTIRVSLTGDPVQEVKTGNEILKALGLKNYGPELISCPTCGRTNIDLIGLAERVERRLEGIKIPLKVAVMGCVVNGPGEAREADVGVAGGSEYGIIFRRGEVLKKVPEAELEDELFKEIERICDESK